MFSSAITNVPHVPRTTAVLDARDLIRNPVRIFERYRKRYGPAFTLHFGGARGALVTTRPDLIEHVLLTRRDNYHMSDIRVKRMAEFQGEGLLNSHGEAWLTKRRFLSQGFRRDRLTGLLPMHEQVLEESMERLDLEARQGVIDIYRIMVGLTFRLVGRSLLGMQLTDHEIERLGSTISTIQGFMLRQIVQPYLIPWFRLSGRSRHYQRMRMEGEQIVRDHIEARICAPGGDDGDILGLLLETPYPDTNEAMSREQILIECMQLLVAANETTPVTLSWAFYLLGRHPRFIRRMREEIDGAFGEGPITFEGLHRLRFVLCVLNETMRLYPPFWAIDRVALRDDHFDGIRIPAGLTVIPYIYGTHRNPQVWTSPETFDPSRFEDEERRARHSFAHIPFGGGPRLCIGSNMAMMQMLLILTVFLRRYDFELARPQEVVDVDPMMILHPKGAIEVRIRRAG